MDSRIKSVYDSVIARDPNQPEFHQAVEEVLESLSPVIEEYPEYMPVIEAMVEAERIIQFRVPWFEPKCKQGIQNSNERLYRTLQRWP